MARQIEPRILFCADSYTYAGRKSDCLERVIEVVGQIPSIEQVVVVAYGDRTIDLRGRVRYAEPTIGFGMQFEALTDTQREAMSAVLGARPAQVA